MRFYRNERFVATEHPNFSCTAISKLPSFETPPLNETFSYSRQLQQILSGKKLLPDEISLSFKLIHEHYLHGYVTYHPGITVTKKQFQCQRCGNQEQHLFAKHNCARCHEDCVYCRRCIAMGKISQCTPLITWNGPQLTYPLQTKALYWQGQLSPGQLDASRQIVRTKEEKLLVWAVCGAGKTEVLFEGINQAVLANQTILLATPRSDVVHELTPRLKQAFPHTSIISLYGGSEERAKQGQIVISTTHQLLRYTHHFDFVIIDEVDAFPFSYDATLKYAVEQAAKPNATTILLTATPDQELQRQVKNIVKIPKRFHGFPLPVPTCRWIGNWQKQLKKGVVPQLLKDKLQATSKPLFLFVPSVTVLEKIVPLLQTQFSFVDGVHAEDPKRHEKVQQFRSGDIRILVTTTILERGVTIPNTDAVVLGADDVVFTESALVQIAGRVGRSAKHPSGEIIFYHYGKTEAMHAAIRQIEEMNSLGGF